MGSYLELGYYATFFSMSESEGLVASTAKKKKIKKSKKSSDCSKPSVQEEVKITPEVNETREDVTQKTTDQQSEEDSAESDGEKIPIPAQVQGSQDSRMDSSSSSDDEDEINYSQLITTLERDKKKIEKRLRKQCRVTNR